MKRLLIATSILLAVTAQAQLDRSRLPEPSTPRPIEIGEYKSFELPNGLKVFVIENNKLPRVAFRLELDRPVIDEGDKTGYLDLVGDMMRRGTDTRSKEQLDEEIDFIGANLLASSDFVFASGLSKYAEKIVELMSDVVLNPIFPDDELEKLKTQSLSSIKQQKETPDAIASKLRAKVLYGDHPYAQIATESSVSNIKTQDLVDFHATYFRPNIGYLAVVGDISFKRAKKLVEAYFSNWEAGEVPVPTFVKPEPLKENTVQLVNRPASVQTVVNVTHIVDLKPRSEESIQASLMNQILGGGASARLFMNLREDKGYTYGAYSSTGADELVGRFNASASVRNEVTDSAVSEMLLEMKRMTLEVVSEEELELAKNARAGAIIRSLENPQTIASYAINTAMYDLPKDFYSTYLTKIEAVSAEDILTISKKLIQPDRAHITVVGKAEEIQEGLKAFGPINYYDAEGNKMDPSSMDLPADLTPGRVIEKYLDAIGGEEKLKEVKTMRVVRSTSMMGQEMTVTIQRQQPDQFVVEMKVGGNPFQKLVFDGEKGQSTGMGGTQDIQGKEAEDTRVEYALFPMMVIRDLKLPTRLVGMDMINGKAAVIMEVTLPSGALINYYFDQVTGLLLQIEKSQETAQGDLRVVTRFSDYKSFEGILMPTKREQTLNPQINLQFQVDAISINPKLDPELFKL